MVQGNKFSESTALGLFQSVIGVILVVASDKIAKSLARTVCCKGVYKHDCYRSICC